ncbi:hypothetical protein ERC79_07900 [Rhodococcus sp. ABRD24]|uniref:hypothetical protein n=1 Tax=Rhodococcus sp. ABRD24 TaxID=2507582 RepID=UPI00103D189F|nr:hypothetical protein [Rhodococcus sp. ABRD24]QBJ95904.1 hypothetical protein ERC79_07900 [Rhodococcus sp. ABRD24]
MSTLITLACIAGLAAFVYRYAPKGDRWGPFRLEQFRPAAPLAGILNEYPKQSGPPEPDRDPGGVRASMPKLD